MNCLRFVRCGVACVLLLSSLSAFAQTASYDVTFNSDNNETTGCSLTASDGSIISGIETRLQATVDIGTQTVSDVSLLSCNGTNFSVDSSLGGGYPVALNQGIGGADAIELAVNQSDAAAASRGLVQLGVLADDGSGSDTLTTTDGSASGAPIMLNTPFAIPSLTVAGLLLLAVLLITAAWFANRRAGHFMTISAVMLVALAAWASQHAADGNLGEWTGTSPRGQDPAGDASNGLSALDIRAVFAVIEDRTLFLRIDVVDIENEAPNAVDNAYSTDEDTTLNVGAPGVLDNDSDPEGDPITALLETPPANADSFTLNADGSFDYTPRADFNGSDSFTYFANDGQADSAPATVTITVNAVNDAPEVIDDSGTTNEDQPLDIDVLANDSDIDGNLDPASVSVTAPPANGTTSVNSTTGVITYTKSGDFNGTDSFDYEVCDDGSPTPAECATATVEVTVDAVNDAPSFTAGGDATVNEDSGAYNAAWAGNIDPGAANESGQALTFDITANDNAALFAAGPAIDPATGNLSFTPAADANGTANVTVELRDDGGTANGGVDTSAPASFVITIEPVNDAPSFTSGGNVDVNEDSGAYNAAWATGLSAGPADESGQTLTFAITGNDNAALFASGPSLDASGNLSFTPAGDAFGTANITVELRDDGGIANGGVDTSAPVNFAINISAVNDAPSFTGGGDVTVLEDAGAVSQAWASAISAGPANEAGQTLTFNITANDNATLFAAGPAIDAAGNLSFTPAADANGTANITVELQDDGGVANGGVDTSASVSFIITVEPVNDAPMVNAPGPFSVAGNVGIQVPDSVDDLLSGVSDPADGGGATPFSVTAGNFASAQNGDVTINADGSFSYNPPAGFEGADSFQFEVCDSGVPLPSACTTASVSLNVSQMIWFVDPSAPAGGDGRPSNPFNDIDALNAVNNGTGNNPAGGDPIFLYSGNHDGQLTLLANQRVFGQGASASLAAMTGITLPAYSAAFPTTGGTMPLWTATNATALTVASGNTLRGFEIGNTGSGTDIAGSAFGTLTVSETRLSGSGQALNLSGGTLANGAGTPGFVAISSSSGSRNISLTNVAGTPVFGGGALSGATGQAFYVDGGTGSFSYSGSISNTTSRVAEIRNKTGGAVTLSGSLTSNSGGTGILVDNNSGGTALVFSGTTKTLSTGAGAAVSLTNNTGATIDFTNGGLGITTTSGTGFTATGGGTVTVTGAANTVGTTTGTGVHIANTTIGSGDVTFRSISVNGAANGIVLDTTGTTGDFIVTGNGGSCTVATPTCTGGRLQSTNGADTAVAGNGIYLSNTGTVSLSLMRIDNHPNHAIFGSSVNGFSLIDSLVDGANGNSVTLDEGSLNFTNLLGSAAITRSVISGGHEDNLRLVNNTGTLNRLVISSSTIRNNSSTDGNDGILVESRGTSIVNITVDGSTFSANRSDHFDANATDSSILDLVFTNNTMSGGHASPLGQSFILSNSSSSDVSLNVSGNTINGALLSAYTFFQSKTTTVSSSMAGSFSGNTIGTTGVNGSGSVQGNGVTFNATGSGTVTAVASNSEIRQWSNPHGLLVQGGDESPVINVTVANNIIKEPNPDGFPMNGLHLNAGTTAAGAVTACLDVETNDMVGSAGTSFDTDFRLRQRNSSTVNLPGYAGGSGDTAAVISFVQANNTGTPTGSAAVSGSGGGFTGTGTACPLP